MIKLIHKAHKDLRRSLGGGVAEVEKTWAVSPKNLVAAAYAARAHIKSSQLALGNIGAGQSWVEVNGVAIDDDSLFQLLIANKPIKDAQDILSSL